MTVTKRTFLAVVCILFITSCQTPPDPKEHCKQVLADWESFLKKPATTACDHHGDCVIYGSKSHCDGQGKGVSLVGVAINKATLPHIKEISDTLLTCMGPFTYSSFSDLEPSTPLCIEGKCNHGAVRCNRAKPP